MSEPTGSNGVGGQEDQLRELARGGEEFVAIGDDGDGQVVIVVGVPEDQAEALTATSGVSVGRVEDEDIERIVLAFFVEDGDPNAQEPAFLIHLMVCLNLPEKKFLKSGLRRKVIEKC
jgi:hypothetical protein